MPEISLLDLGFLHLSQSICYVSCEFNSSFLLAQMKIWIFHLLYTLADSNFSIVAIPCCNSYSTGSFLDSDYLARWWILGLIDFCILFNYLKCWEKAFKKAAESAEKLLDVTREELPDTMAAIRLSGMEISDLTMELSDLGFVSVFAHTPTITCQFFFFICVFFLVNLQYCVGKASLKVLKARHGRFA